MVSAKSAGAAGAPPGVAVGGFPPAFLAGAGKTEALLNPFRICCKRESARPAALEDIMKRRLGRRSWLGVVRWPFRPWDSAPLTNLLVFLFSIINQTHRDLFSSEFVQLTCFQVVIYMGFDIGIVSRDRPQKTVKVGRLTRTHHTLFSTEDNISTVALNGVFIRVDHAQKTCAVSNYAT